MTEVIPDKEDDNPDALPLEGEDIDADTPDEDDEDEEDEE